MKCINFDKSCHKYFVEMYETDLFILHTNVLDAFLNMNEKSPFLTETEKILNDLNNIQKEI